MKAVIYALTLVLGLAGAALADSPSDDNQGGGNDPPKGASGPQGPGPHGSPGPNGNSGP